MQFTNKRACQILGWDRKTQGDDLGSGHCQFTPPAQTGLRLWGVDDLTAARFYIDQRRAGFTVKLAGEAATRLRSGMRAHPDADQLTAIDLENGSKSILPTSSLDLSSGYVSGGHVATATMIDVRNLRARVQRAIDADAKVIGGGND